MFLGSRPIDDPASDAGRFLCRLALIILMIVTPGAEVASRLAIYSLLPIGAAVLFIAGLVVGTGEVPRRLARIILSPLGLAAIVLSLWAGLSLLWTPFPGEASARFIKALSTEILVVLAILFLPERTRPANLYLLPIGLALAAIATLVFSVLRPHYFNGGAGPDAALAQRCTMSMVMLVFPALGALSLRERWRLAAALAALVVAAALAAFVQVALAAFAVGALVYVAAMANPSRVAKVCGYFFAGLVVGAPILALALTLLANLLPHAGLLAPAKVAGGLVLHQWPRLITGHGLDMTVHAIDIGYLPPTTPRSLLFQLWYDLGIIGALSFAFLTAGAFLIIGRLSPTYAPPILGGFATGLVIAICGAETTQVWWITLNGLNAIAFAIFVKAHMRRKRLTAAAFEDTAQEMQA